MGYRNYLGKVKKSKHDELGSLTNDQLVNLYGDVENNGDYVDVKEITDHVKLYELGKYCDFDITKTTKRFFKEKLPYEDDCEFIIASKEFLESIIEDYKKYIINFYTNIQNNSEEKKEYYFKNKITEWVTLNPYNLDLDNDTIVDSWKYEYAIFELVRIYKTFDWKNYLLIYSGG